MFGETQNWQNILPIPMLENVEKMHWAHVLEAQMQCFFLVLNFTVKNENLKNLPKFQKIIKNKISSRNKLSSFTASIPESIFQQRFLD